MSCITLYSCVMEAFIDAGVATFFEFHVGSSGFLTKLPRLQVEDRKLRLYALC